MTIKIIRNYALAMLIAAAATFGFGTAASASLITPLWATGGTDSANLEAAFFGSYSDVVTEDFSGFTAGQTAPIGIAVGSLEGGGYLGDSTTVQSPYGEFSVGSDDNYWSNGTPGSTSGKSTFSVTFDRDVFGFGFYGTDLHDKGGEVLLTFATDAGDVTLNLYDLVGAQGSGEINYFAFRSDSAISGVTFNAAGNDGYAVDSISTATPIPGAVWLLGSALAGLLGLRRVFG